MRRDYLVRLRPRDDTRYVSQGRTVLATGRDGFSSAKAASTGCSSTRRACCRATATSSQARRRARPRSRTSSPQAWSASAVFTLLQSLLGLYPYAPLRLLLVDPRLPAWLPDITLRSLRVGAARVSLRFYREESGATDYEVLEKEGDLHILRQPSPWSLTATWAERLKDALTSLLPGR